MFSKKYFPKPRLFKKKNVQNFFCPNNEQKIIKIKNFAITQNKSKRAKYLVSEIYCPKSHRQLTKKEVFMIEMKPQEEKKAWMIKIEKIICNSLAKTENFF